MKRLIFTLVALLSILTAGAQDFMIVVTGSNGQPEAYTLDEISSWGYTGDKFFINDENQAQVFSATGDKFNFSSAEQEEGDYFVIKFFDPKLQARFLIGPDFKINWKDAKLTVKDKNRSEEFVVGIVPPTLSIEAGTFGYVDPGIIELSPSMHSLCFIFVDNRFSDREREKKFTSFSNAYTLSIDEDYFYFSGPAGIIKLSRSNMSGFDINTSAYGTFYE
jgi:hypothetical protein